MYVRVCVCIYMYMCACVSTCVYVCVSMCIKSFQSIGNVAMCVCMCVCVCVCVLCACVGVCGQDLMSCAGTRSIMLILKLLLFPGTQ
jgi:hypothetical protein